MKHQILLLLAFSSLTVSAQAETDSTATHRRLPGGMTLTVEGSATLSSGDFSPLWFSANRYGLASVRNNSGYQRATLTRSLQNDSAHSWKFGFGADVAIAENHERTVIIQQAYAEASWKQIHFTIGSKAQEMETQSADLSSGALAFGINARPIPQIRLDVDWFAIPGTNGWWQWKFHGSYGFLTDGHWQEQWAAPDTRYTRHTLYHEKALYWKIGRTDLFPLSYEIGLRMASQFGGTSYNITSTRLGNENQLTDIKHPTNLRAFWDVLTCQGSDATDGSDPNTSGNHLGSYIMALTYHAGPWQARAYWERFFEDQSMLTVQYGIRDMLIGGEVRTPHNPFVDGACLEFITTTNQSGAVYHDRTDRLPDKMNGRDNYYNHQLFPGWQHYGFTLGNPFITSPLYNQNHTLTFLNNRIKAWHIALTGQPTSAWRWRILASFTRNWGTYAHPYADRLSQQYFLAESTYHPRWLQGWSATGGLAIDHGSLTGNNTGVQITIRKTFEL